MRALKRSFRMFVCRKMPCSYLVGNHVGESIQEGPEMIELTNEQGRRRQGKAKEAHTRHERVTAIASQALEFQPGEHDCLKVQPYTWSQGVWLQSYLISKIDQIREDLSYTEEPESILDRQDRVMRNKTIPFVKILWRNHPEREATWETEESIRTSISFSSMIWYLEGDWA
ncbi:putative nucleotidyltransferase, ribonuclease H [Tanacetum coccineum]